MPSWFQEEQFELDLKKVFAFKAHKIKGLPLTRFEGTERGLEVQLHSFLTSALDGDMW